MKYAGMDKIKKDLLAGAVLSTRKELDMLKKKWRTRDEAIRRAKQP